MNQILIHPSLNKVRNTPFYSSLTSFEYNYLLESYVRGRTGVNHLHLPGELVRLKRIQNESKEFKNNLLSKNSYDHESTKSKYNSSIKSDTQKNILEEDEILSQFQSTTDFLNDPIVNELHSSQINFYPEDLDFLEPNLS